MKKMIVSTSTSCLDDLGIPENVKMLPMNIHMGGANYLDGQNLSLDSLSRILLDTPNIDISTSAPTENQLIEFFYQLIKEDVQEVLFICLSSSLSQTYKNLLNISSMFSHRMKIYIYDSRTISHGEAVMVLEASKLLNQGATMPEIITEINRLRALTPDELYVAAKELQAPYDLVAEVARTGQLPVVLFTAGGVATPADAAMMMQLGADGVFVGSGIFKSGDPAKRAQAIVKATAFYDDLAVIADVSRGLGEAMVGINVADLRAPHRLAERGW